MTRTAAAAAAVRQVAAASRLRRAKRRTSSTSLVILIYLLVSILAVEPSSAIVVSSSAAEAASSSSAVALEAAAVEEEEDEHKSFEGGEVELREVVSEEEEMQQQQQQQQQIQSNTIESSYSPPVRSLNFFVRFFATTIPRIGSVGRRHHASDPTQPLSSSNSSSSSYISSSDDGNISIGMYLISTSFLAFLLCSICFGWMLLLLAFKLLGPDRLCLCGAEVGLAGNAVRKPDLVALHASAGGGGGGGGSAGSAGGCRRGRGRGHGGDGARRVGRSGRQGRGLGRAAHHRHHRHHHQYYDDDETDINEVGGCGGGEAEAGSGRYRHDQHYGVGGGMIAENVGYETTTTTTSTSTVVAKNNATATTAVAASTSHRHQIASAKEQELWTDRINAIERRVTRMRLAFLIAGTTLLASSGVLITFGVVRGMDEALNDVRRGAEKMGDIIGEAASGAMVVEKASIELREASEGFLSLLSTSSTGSGNEDDEREDGGHGNQSAPLISSIFAKWCPKCDERNGTVTVSVVSTDSYGGSDNSESTVVVPIASVLLPLAADLLRSVDDDDAVFAPAKDTGELGSDLADLSSQLHAVSDGIYASHAWLFRSFITFAIVVDCVALVLMAGTVAAWRERSSESTQRLLTVVVAPAFVALLSLAAAISALISIGAVASSDFCDAAHNGEKSALLNALVLERGEGATYEENLDDAGGGTYYQRTFEYLASSCKTERPVDFLSPYPSKSDSIISSSDAFRLQLSSYPTQELSQALGITPNVLALTLDASLNLSTDVSIYQSNIRTLHDNILTCQNIYPTYDEMVAVGICNDATVSMTWMFGCLAVMVICGMTMITLRASWRDVLDFYEPTEWGAGGSGAEQQHQHQGTTKPPSNRRRSSAGGLFGIGNGSVGHREHGYREDEPGHINHRRGQDEDLDDTSSDEHTLDNERERYYDDYEVDDEGDDEFHEDNHQMADSEMRGQNYMHPQLRQHSSQHHHYRNGVMVHHSRHDEEIEDEKYDGQSLVSLPVTVRSNRTN